MAVVKRFNCTVVNAKKEAGGIIRWAMAHPAHDTAVFFRDQFIYVFVIWRKINGPVNACHSFYLVIRSGVNA